MELLTTSLPFEPKKSASTKVLSSPQAVGVLVATFRRVWRAWRVTWPSSVSLSRAIEPGRSNWSAVLPAPVLLSLNSRSALT
ncbi:hypothetical protein D3C86_2036630 [compost metagenome]